MKKFGIFALVLAATVGVAACHKDNEDSINTYLKGTLSFSTPTYVRAGTTLTVTPTGIKHPEGKSVGYIWSISVLGLRDTVKYEGEDPEFADSSLTFTVPDTTAGSVVVTVTAYAKWYYNTTSSRTITSVLTTLDGDGSMLGTGIEPTDPFITDERNADGPEWENWYYYTPHGDLDWFRNNLAYTGNGIPYMNNEPVSYVFGRYYTWYEALQACPEGWRLPTDEEWADLVSELTGATLTAGTDFPDGAGALMVNGTFNSSALWTFWPDVTITNTSKLAVLPMGYASVENGARFGGWSEYAAFWTATEKDATQAYYRYIYEKTPQIYAGLGDKNSFAASVRCVRDHVE